MGQEKTKTAAIICHGYQAGPLFMTFIKRTLRKSGLFHQVINLELYNSWFGLITDRYSVVSPIIQVNETILDQDMELTNANGLVIPVDHEVIIWVKLTDPPYKYGTKAEIVITTLEGNRYIEFVVLSSFIS